LDGKRFYVGLFETVEEALAAQVARRQEILQAAKDNPQSYKELSGRTATGEEEIQKVRKAQAEGAPLTKVCFHSCVSLAVFKRD
jgi:erythromycin esterase-like protein